MSEFVKYTVVSVSSELKYLFLAGEINKRVLQKLLKHKKFIKPLAKVT